jgi:1-deoxy-D-xylulose-5-phosphate reductoisomerase
VAAQPKQQPKQRVAILGSTGSIGRQAIEVIQAHPDRFEVVALVAGHDADVLAAQARVLNVELTGIGSRAAEEMAALESADIVLNAVVGSAGLRASIAALEAGKRLALANKESLVAGGEACNRAAISGGGEIIPVDSEHAAIAQCLQGLDRDDVKRIILTASGGPFRSRPDTSDVTPAEALAHPTWSMGPKITVDSATLMNKGLEVIEAHHLFGFDYDSIGIVVHPQSAVHGIVELVDATMLMQEAPTDMRIPIQAALAWPDRLPAGDQDDQRLDLSALGKLDFEPVDPARFPLIEIAYEAGRCGGLYPAVMNAANEIAVQAFLEGTVAFDDIVRVVRETIDEIAEEVSSEELAKSDLDSVLHADEGARDVARRMIEKRTASRLVGDRSMSEPV